MTTYDPVKAHEYYMRTRKLKGGRSRSTKASSSRKTSNSRGTTTKRVSSADPAKVKSRITRLRTKVSTLEGALSKAQAALSEKRQAERKTDRENSDGKSTVKERKSAKEYRDRNKASIANKRKGDSSSTDSSSKSSKSESSIEDLENRVLRIKKTLYEAKKQLATATMKLGELKHSELKSDPMAEEKFARFQSAERIPSK